VDPRGRLCSSYSHITPMTHKSSNLTSHVSNDASFKERVPYNVVGDQSNSASKGSLQSPGGGYRTPTPAKPRQITRKSMGGDARSSRKRPQRKTPATSSGSTLTNISTASRGSKQVIDYQDDNVYSLFRLSLPRPSLHKV
jgi:hypothetical protein